jgi:formylmethanofuran dehydrogenase subunit E
MTSTSSKERADRVTRIIHPIKENIRDDEIRFIIGLMILMDTLTERTISDLEKFLKRFHNVRVIIEERECDFCEEIRPTTFVREVLNKDLCKSCIKKFIDLAQKTLHITPRMTNITE